MSKITAKKNICICKKCKHNMGRSRCKPSDTGWVVRCNACKTVYNVSIKKESK